MAAAGWRSRSGGYGGGMESKVGGGVEEGAGKVWELRTSRIEE